MNLERLASFSLQTDSVRFNNDLALFIEMTNRIFKAFFTFIEGALDILWCAFIMKGQEASIFV